MAVVVVGQLAVAGAAWITDVVLPVDGGILTARGPGSALTEIGILQQALPQRF
ncbi:MAG: hypothetical protein ACRDQA_18955 [Nocardioidaceae bacterium]